MQSMPSPAAVNAAVNAAGRACTAALVMGCAAALLQLAGCATALGERAAPSVLHGKRHSPVEIASYTPAQFSWALASAVGTASAREAAMAQVRAAAAGAADDATLVQALRAIDFYATHAELGRMLVREALADTGRPLPARDAETQRAVLTAVFSLDAEGSEPLLLPLLEQFAAPRQFAIAAYTLRRADAGAAMRQQVRSALARRQDGADPRLIALTRTLDADEATAAPLRPPLPDLLAAPLLPGLPVVFSLQRRDRRQMGLAVVRGADGRFVREADGRLFAVPHLALALSGLPGTITLGNTPQGLFTVVGAGTAENPWIGPTPYLESKLPIEAGVAEFTHGQAAGTWTEAQYEALLPASWRNFLPFKEAWLAGLAGRDEMLAHGTAVDPAPYQGQSYYPGTPTDGCLMAQEFWADDGRLLRSDQLRLAKAFTRGGRDTGALVLVELDDVPAPVLLQEVETAIAQAERRP